MTEYLIFESHLIEDFNRFLEKYYEDYRLLKIYDENDNESFLLFNLTRDDIKSVEADFLRKMYQIYSHVDEETFNYITKTCLLTPS